MTDTDDLRTFKRLDKTLDEPGTWRLDNGIVIATCPSCSNTLNLSTVAINSEGVVDIVCRPDTIVFPAIHRPCGQGQFVILEDWPSHAEKPRGSRVLRRMAAVSFSPELIMNMTAGTFTVIGGAVPEGATIVGQGYDPQRRVFFIQLVHGQFELVAEGGQVPDLTPPMISPTPHEETEDGQRERLAAIAGIIEDLDDYGITPAMFMNKVTHEHMKRIFQLASLKPHSPGKGSG